MTITDPDDNVLLFCGDEIEELKLKSLGTALEAVFRYHESTKHHFGAYAKGPGQLEWATQPDPFRRYQGSQLVPLDKIVHGEFPGYDQALDPGAISPCPLNRKSISQLFYDSLAISAWKSISDSTWALRVNPSSGNLHPTEAYMICGPIEGLCASPMVSHYAPKEHGLEVLAEIPSAIWDAFSRDLPAETLLIALTSIHWREAWKYGQRAYRYCQHDAGHAIGAVGMSAAGLGWNTRILDDLSTQDLARLSGTFRQSGAEAEEADLLIAVTPSDATLSRIARKHAASFEALDWQGQPNLLSPAHIDWDIAPVANAAHKPDEHPAYETTETAKQPRTRKARPAPLGKIIHQRRSAVAMDGKTHISRDTFFQMLERTLPTTGNTAFLSLPWRPHIHLAIFVHRVRDMSAGLYILIRDPLQIKALQNAITRADDWVRPKSCPDNLDLYCIAEADTRNAARQISCMQDIASDSCFSLGMIADFETPLQAYGPWFYPRLFWEAGVIGQMLYLEAEAAGIRSTGIGCFFDDPMHEALGLQDRQYQDLYHFTVGGPIEDDRLTTLPPYPDA